MKLRYIAALILALFLSVLEALVPLQAQTVSPASIGPVCTGFPVSIALPQAAVTDQVDVFFLFDDTSSFEDFAPSVIGIFGGLVNSLETALPGVSFGFGVGRFEDYGGPGAGFAVPQASVGRPFILNQPIVTTETAGGAAPRDALINTALARTAPGLGGDPPESAMEGLNQVATGSGFDGDGNGSNLDSGVAGAAATQTTPGTSGDVPPFSSNTLPASGSLGGAGWRPGALHLIIVVTDICPVAAFPFGSPIPAFITGAGSGTSSEPAAAFACPASKPGVNRFGFVSDSKAVEGNTIVDANNSRTAVAPLGAATVQGTVSALNGLGIRVLGMGPGVAPTPFLGPSFDPSTWLSAMARVTGAVDALGSPLVFDTDVSLDDLSAAILSGITTTTTLPLDISLTTSSLPPGLAFSFSPQVVSGVSPGGSAPFDVALDAGGSAVSGTFDLNFIDVSSAQVLGTIPVTVSCLDNSRAEVSIVKTTNGTDNDTAPGPSVLVGSSVTWTYLVTNTGTAPLTNLAVTDDKVGLICTIAALDAGATRSCTKTGAAVAGAYENTGTVTGASPKGSTVTASNVDHYFGARPAIAIVKTTNGTNNDAAPGPSILGGSTVTWTYLVTNTGNVALTNVTVTDDKAGAICTVGMLAAGASRSCTTSGIAVAGQYRNVGTATGTPPVGPAVTASDSDHYFGVDSGTFFVIGDVETHRIGDEVNFWGAQWWKNNQMSGLVTPGVASFKGYALQVVLTGDCGGTWTTRPGNSPPPPDVIPLYVPIIVTDTVAKSGPDIRGTIKEILVVLQDGGYGPNPGHRGNGRVISSVCK